MIQNIYDKILEKMENTNDIPSFLQHRIDDKWQGLSSQAFIQHVRYIAAALIEKGIKPGDKVAIWGFNSTQWFISHFAVAIIGAVTVPIYPNIADSNLKYIIQHTNAALVICDRNVHDFKQLQQFPNLAIISWHTEGNDHSPQCINQGINQGIDFWENLLTLGKQRLFTNPSLLAHYISKDMSSLALVCFTSGTSNDKPKGAEITHGNLLSAITNIDVRFSPEENERLLSFLPLAHIYSLILSLHTIWHKNRIYFLSNHHELIAACQEVKPTLLPLVPRVLEKMHNNLLRKIQKESAVRKHLGLWAVNVAHESYNKAISWQKIIAERILFRPLRAMLGGHLRYVFVGGAPFSMQLNRFFSAMDIPIYEGYGLTEGLLISCNLPNEKKVGTVGKLFHGIETIISSQGELLVRGPQIMHCYHLDDESTSRAIDDQGFLHTGDIATIDGEGFLTVSGRIKDLCKTSTGEYVAVGYIEKELLQIPYVDFPVVIAEGKRFVSTLLFLNIEVIEELKIAQKRIHLSTAEFLEGAFIKNLTQYYIDKINANLTKESKIRAFRFITTSPSIETGELTPTMKVRHMAIGNKYTELIEDIYREAI